MNIGESPLVTVAMSMGRLVPSFEITVWYIYCEDRISMALSQALSQAPRFSYFSIIMYMYSIEKGVDLEKRISIIALWLTIEIINTSL